MFPIPLFCSSPLPTSESRTFPAVYSEPEEGKCLQLPNFLLCPKIALELKVLLSFLNDCCSLLHEFLTPGLWYEKKEDGEYSCMMWFLSFQSVQCCGGPLTGSSTWFELDNYWWLSLRKKGGFENNNCICLRKFSRSQMGGLDTICSWQTMSPWANFFIFLCLTFPGITGELKNELGKSTNLRNVYRKRFRTVTYIRSLSTVGRKPDCTECKWILALFSSYFLSSKHKNSNKVNLIICIILNRSVTGIDLIIFYFLFLDL